MRVFLISVSAIRDYTTLLCGDLVDGKSHCKDVSNVIYKQQLVSSHRLRGSQILRVPEPLRQFVKIRED